MKRRLATQAGTAGQAMAHGAMAHGAPHDGGRHVAAVGLPIDAVLGILPPSATAGHSGQSLILEQTTYLSAHSPKPLKDVPQL